MGLAMSLGWSDAASAPELKRLPGLMVRCRCGHGKAFDDEALAVLAAQGISTTSHLKRKLRCSACSERDSLDLIPILRRAG